MPAFSGVPCPEPSCSSWEPVPDSEQFKNYFESRLWNCSQCGHEVNLWTLLLARIQDDNPLLPGIVSLGLGSFTVISHPLEFQTTAMVSFIEYGVPEDATIIDVVITPQTVGPGVGLLPTVGIQHLQARGLPHHLVLHPGRWNPMPDLAPDDADTTANILIIWLPRPSKPDVEPLLSAAHAYSTGDYRAAIVPAQIAVETRLASILSGFFENVAGKGHVQNFLTDGATYGHQLRFLLPTLFRIAGAPPMTNAVIESLQKLRSKRNRVGHEHQSTERAEAAPLLLGALFGYRYLEQYQELLPELARKHLG